MRRGALLLLTLAAFVGSAVLGAAYAQTPTATGTGTPQAGSMTVIGPLEYPEDINTLTGLPFPDDVARNRRNLIVKVSNFPQVVRPQSGLHAADIVYEYEVEGGVTRFAAIYRSQGSEHVGSLRSGRLFDFELVVAYSALWAFSGVNDNLLHLIQEADWRYQAISPMWGDNCPPFCRFPEPGLAYEHTMFGNTYQMWDLATERGVNVPVNIRGFAFREAPESGGQAVNDIAIRWFGDQDARWQYNPADQRWYRWNTGLPHYDIESGQQLSAANIIILQMHHVDRPDIYETEGGTRTLGINMWGREKAIICRDGRCFEGWWIRRQDRSGLGLYYDYEATQPILLRPGNSWIEIVRCCTMPGVTLSETPEDVLATATFAARTATAHAPQIPADALTATAPAAATTFASSAATAQWHRTPAALGAAPATLTSTPTPTP